MAGNGLSTAVADAGSDQKQSETTAQGLDHRLGTSDLNKTSTTGLMENTNLVFLYLIFFICLNIYIIQF